MERQTLDETRKHPTESVLNSRTWIRNLLGLPYIDPATPLVIQDGRKSKEARLRGFQKMEKLKRDPAFNERAEKARREGVQAYHARLRAEIPPKYQKLYDKTRRELGAKQAREQIKMLVANDRAKADCATSQ